MAIASAMIASTTFEVQGRRIREYKGMVRGIIVRAPTISQGLLGGLKSFVGGQIGAYTEMCANAVVGVRYDASDVGGSSSAATEVLCYGTAVVLE